MTSAGRLLVLSMPRLLGFRVIGLRARVKALNRFHVSLLRALPRSQLLQAFAEAQVHKLETCFRGSYRVQGWEVYWCCEASFGVYKSSTRLGALSGFCVRSLMGRVHEGPG